mmetsp:Transcript_72679/g.170299  ORF Transcript_72679/g.170299 Transcript_72679/m.170299 type:complete len:333 (-) Transcript_72679:377-1375(-)
MANRVLKELQEHGGNACRRSLHVHVHGGRQGAQAAGHLQQRNTAAPGISRVRPVGSSKGHLRRHVRHCTDHCTGGHISPHQHGGLEIHNAHVLPVTSSQRGNHQVSQTNVAVGDVLRVQVGDAPHYLLEAVVHLRFIHPWLLPAGDDRLDISTAGELHDQIDPRRAVEHVQTLGDVRVPDHFAHEAELTVDALQQTRVLSLALLHDFDGDGLLVHVYCLEHRACVGWEPANQPEIAHGIRGLQDLIIYRAELRHKGLRDLLPKKRGMLRLHLRSFLGAVKVHLYVQHQLRAQHVRLPHGAGKVYGSLQDCHISLGLEDDIVDPRGQQLAMSP